MMIKGDLGEREHTTSVHCVGCSLASNLLSKGSLEMGQRGGAQRCTRNLLAAASSTHSFVPSQKCVCADHAALRCQPFLVCGLLLSGANPSLCATCYSLAPTLVCGLLLSCATPSLSVACRTLAPILPLLTLLLQSLFPTISKGNAMRLISADAPCATEESLATCFA
eukprot:1156350-Pelagomonas_calceolata.AAC.24